MRAFGPDVERSLGDFFQSNFFFTFPIANYLGIVRLFSSVFSGSFKEIVSKNFGVAGRLSFVR